MVDSLIPSGKILCMYRVSVFEAYTVALVTFICKCYDKLLDVSRVGDIYCDSNGFTHSEFIFIVSNGIQYRLVKVF